MTQGYLLQRCHELRKWLVWAVEHLIPREAADILVGAACLEEG